MRENKILNRTKLFNCFSFKHRESIMKLIYIEHDYKPFFKLLGFLQS